MPQPDPQSDARLDAEPLRTALVSALQAAWRARLGVPSGMEPIARQYGRALRMSGMPIEKAVVHVKEIVRDETRGDEGVFIGKLVGWTIAGYFAGTDPPTQRASG